MSSLHWQAGSLPIAHLGAPKVGVDSVQPFSRVRPFVTPWTARQTCLSVTVLQMRHWDVKEFGFTSLKSSGPQGSQSPNSLPPSLWPPHLCFGTFIWGQHSLGHRSTLPTVPSASHTHQHRETCLLNEHSVKAHLVSASHFCWKFFLKVSKSQWHCEEWWLAG